MKRTERSLGRNEDLRKEGEIVGGISGTTSAESKINEASVKD
jgi:hypothetical protein